MSDNPLQQFACPYDTRLFQNEEDLWVHVSDAHLQLLEELGIKGDTALYRKLLRKEALDKAKALAAEDRSQERSATSPQYIQDPPNLRKLSLDAQRPHPLPCRGYSPDQSSAGSAERLPRDGRAAEPTRPVIRASPSRSHSRQAATFQPDLIQTSSTVRCPGLVQQPDSRPLSQEQLVTEVKSIYAGLTMVESKCIHVEKTQATAKHGLCQSELALDHWQGLIALHRSLLHEHYDFFLASQHPSASPALRHLAAKYSMPARMWKHGIHSFLELLRHRLPESMQCMLSFIDLAYQMMALLYETVPFEDTWIECLGDLGRYRMAIEDEDLRNRAIWGRVARSCFSKTAKETSATGRLYRRLAILASPDDLRLFFEYDRPLTCDKHVLWSEVFDEIDSLNYSSADIIARYRLNCRGKRHKAALEVQASIQHINDWAFLRHDHAALAFLAGLAQKDAFLENLATDSWRELANLLNIIVKSRETISTSGLKTSKASSSHDVLRPVSGDHTMCGLIWNELYFPRSSLLGDHGDDEERSIELPSMSSTRLDRAPWLQKGPELTTADGLSGSDSKIKANREASMSAVVSYCYPLRRAAKPDLACQCHIEHYWMQKLSACLRSLLYAFVSHALFGLIRPAFAQSLASSLTPVVEASQDDLLHLPDADCLALKILTSGLSFGTFGLIVVAGPWAEPYVTASLVGLPIAWWNMRSDPYYDPEVEWLILNIWLSGFLGSVISRLISRGRAAAESVESAAPNVVVMDAKDTSSMTVVTTATKTKTPTKASNPTSETIVILMPYPKNVPEIRQDEEARNIEKVTERDRLVHLSVKFHLNCCISEICDIIRRSNATFLHIISHGSKKGPLFQNDIHHPTTVNPRYFADSLKQAKGLKCMLVNACFSSDYGAVIADITGAIVIGMNGQVGDRAAINFATEFFKAIADGQVITQAFETAKYAAGMYSNGGRLRPEIFHPSSTHPSPIASD